MVHVDPVIQERLVSVGPRDDPHASVFPVRIVHRQPHGEGLHGIDGEKGGILVPVHRQPVSGPLADDVGGEEGNVRTQNLLCNVHQGLAEEKIQKVAVTVVHRRHVLGSGSRRQLGDEPVDLLPQPGQLPVGQNLPAPEETLLPVLFQRLLAEPGHRAITAASSFRRLAWGNNSGLFLVPDRSGRTSYGPRPGKSNPSPWPVWGSSGRGRPVAVSPGLARGQGRDRVGRGPTAELQGVLKSTFRRRPAGVAP